MCIYLSKNVRSVSSNSVTAGKWLNSIEATVHRDADVIVEVRGPLIVQKFQSLEFEKQRAGCLVGCYHSQ